MLALPEGFRGIAPDLRGYGDADPMKKIDATRGMRDLSDDVAALLHHLGIEQAHIVGCSLGGAVVWQMMRDHPTRFLSITQVSPGSPRTQEGDRSTESPFSPRVSLRGLFIEPFIPPREEELLTSVLAIHLGEQDFPGDFVPSPNWPFVAPGVWGPANAMSPKYIGDVSELWDGRIKLPVLWIRGSHDQVISDTSTSDPGYLGKLGFIPGWPGDEVFPPQPMLKQIRTVLKKYAAAGGSYEEVVIQDAAHIPFIEQPQAFNAVLHVHLGAG